VNPQAADDWCFVRPEAAGKGLGAIGGSGVTGPGAPGPPSDFHEHTPAPTRRENPSHLITQPAVPGLTNR
jgi:hypothetical protein